MRRVYFDSWDGLRSWMEGVHSTVSVRMEEFATPIAESVAHLDALCGEPESGDELEYACVLAAGGWLHVLQASVSDGSVEMSSYRLSRVTGLRTRIAGESDGESNFEASVALDDGVLLEWRGHAPSRSSRRAYSEADAGNRFVDSIRRRLSSSVS